MQKNRFRFTVKSLQSLPVPADGERLIVYDNDVRQLGLRVVPSRLTFFVLAKHRGKTTRITLGVFPAMSIEAAKNHARSWLRDLGDWKARNYVGIDPLAARRIEEDARTLRDAMGSYIASQKFAEGI